MRTHIFPVTIVLVAAFALRTLALTVAPLYPDEAAQISLAFLPLGEFLPLNQLWVRAEPPLPALLLRVWFVLTGVSAFTARYLSVLVGMVGVAAGAALARRLLRSPQMASLSAGVLAILPVFVMTGRSASGDVYAISGVLLFAAIITGQRAGWGAWVAATASAALALGGSLLAGAGLVLVALAGRWRTLSAAALGVAGLLWLPYLLPLRPTLTEAFTNPRYFPDAAPRTILEFPTAIFGGMLLGPVEQPAIRTVILGGMALIALLGLASLPRRALLFSVVLWGGLVGAALLALQTLGYAPPALVLPALIAVALSLGAGLSQFKLRHTGSWGFVLVACVGVAVSQILSPAPDPNLRPLTAYIAQRAQPGDVVLFSQPWEVGSLALALPGEVTYLPDTSPTPGQALAQYGRIWELTYEGSVQNQPNLSGQWLLDNAAWDGGRMFDEADTEVSLFIAPELALNAEGERTCYDMDAGILTFCVAPFRVASLSPGPVAFNGVWVLNEEVFSTYSAFVEVVPAAEEQPARRVELLIANQQLSFNAFPPAEPVPDSFLLDLTGLPPGIYDVRFGVFNPRSGAQVLVDGGPADTIPLGSIVLTGGD